MDPEITINEGDMNKESIYFESTKSFLEQNLETPPIFTLGLRRSSSKRKREYMQRVCTHEVVSKQPAVIEKPETEDPNLSRIHFAYLFASPLLIDMDGRQEEDMLAEISFKEEFQGIIEGLDKEGIGIRYRYQLATL